MEEKRIELSQDQKAALAAMLSGENVCLTGEAGTGKSTVVKEFMRRKKDVAIAAPTGIAAINVGGATLHSLFKLGLGVQTPSSLDEKKRDEKLEKVLRAIGTLVIDEISMVRSDMMMAIDYRLRQFCDRDKPFGGKQVVCVGDFFQLPPVVTASRLEGSDMLLEDFLADNYGGVYAFEAQAWAEGRFSVQRLTEIHRQAGDMEFVRLLNGCRRGEWDAGLYSRIRVARSAEGAVCLTPTKAEAERINSGELEALEGAVHAYNAAVDGDFAGNDGKKTSDDQDPAPRILRLKKDAKVILLVNNSDAGYVNGDTGVVTSLGRGGIGVKLDREDKTVIVELNEWKKTRYVYDNHTRKLSEETIGSFRQYPLRLAYAITIHKSQGMTLDRVHICFGKRGIFAPGQLYVAMSRCRSLAGLSISRPIGKDDVLTNDKVASFYDGLPAPATLVEEGPIPIPEMDTGSSEEDDGVMVRVPKALLGDVMELIDRFQNGPKRARHEEAGTEEVVQKRQEKAGTEQDISTYSDDVQDALSRLQPAEKALYRLLREEGGAQAQEIADRQGVSAVWVRKAMTNLVKAGLVNRNGSKKTGVYESAEKDEWSFSGKCKRCPLLKNNDD